MTGLMLELARRCDTATDSGPRAEHTLHAGAWALGVGPENAGVCPEQTPRATTFELCTLMVSLGPLRLLKRTGHGMSTEASCQMSVHGKRTWYWPNRAGRAVPGHREPGSRVQAATLTVWESELESSLARACQPSAGLLSRAHRREHTDRTGKATSCGLWSPCPSGVRQCWPLAQCPQEALV